MAEPEIVILAANFARLRCQRKLSQFQVASRSGVQPSEVSRIEQGRRDIRVSTLVRLARALQVKPGQLLDGA